MQVIHIKQPKRKTYSLHIDHQGNLIVKTDTTFLPSQVDKLIEKHKSWIKKQIEIFKNQIDIFKKDYLAEGEVYNVLGQEYTLKYVQRDEWQYAYSIELTKNKLIITVNPKVRVAKYQLKAELIKFFKNYARNYLNERVEFFSKKYGVSYQKVFIRNQKTKWGSCSSNGNLNFNWHLIFAPKPIVDYVIIHEISHLTHMNHSERFWSLVHKRCKNFEVKKKWLKENERLVRVLA